MDQLVESPFGSDRAPAPAPHLKAGAQCGRYELLSRVGWGGMAEVYLARSMSRRNFGERVVIKRMLPALVDKRGSVQLFLREARLAASFDHPNLVRVHEIGDMPGDYFYAMEYIDGHDLLAILRQACLNGAAMPIEQAVRIAIGVAAALDYAHDHCAADGTPLRIVHRDVSPSNVMVAHDGTVKLLDFGIAKADAEDTHVKTERGAVRGKLSYLSPEQCLSLPLDHRSDLFALGILLYEMTVGRRLFYGDTVLKTVDMITLGDPPPPRSVRSRYPAALERIVMRALAREPEQRYQTAGAMKRDLVAFAHKHRFDAASGLAGYMTELFGPAREVPTERELPTFDRAISTVSRLAALAELRSASSLELARPVVVFSEPAFEAERTDVDTPVPSLRGLVCAATAAPSTPVISSAPPLAPMAAAPALAPAAPAPSPAAPAPAPSPAAPAPTAAAPLADFIRSVSGEWLLGPPRQLFAAIPPRARPRWVIPITALIAVLFVASLATVGYAALRPVEITVLPPPATAPVAAAPSLPRVVSSEVVVSVRAPRGKARLSSKPAAPGKTAKRGPSHRKNWRLDLL